MTEHQIVTEVRGADLKRVGGRLGAQFYTCYVWETDWLLIGWLDINTGIK